jgi:predicted AlkP superfamily pyrophosphatase or phosphodiesterase
MSFRLGFPASILLVSCTACATPPAVEYTSSDTRPVSIVLVGMDGLEWNVMRPLLREGRLPNFAKLIERGVAGKLETLEPTVSPTIWTTVATGTDREAHGILGFVDKTGEMQAEGRLYTNLDRKTKAFWNILSDYNRSVAVVGWWLTYPVEPVNGIMVAQTNTTRRDEITQGDKIWKGTLYADKQDQVWPPAMQSEILGFVDDVERDLPELVRSVLGAMPAEAGPVPRRLLEKCRWAFRADEIYRRVGLRLLRDAKELGLFSIYFGIPDVMGHRFWRYAEPERYDVPPTAAEVEMFGDYIARAYVHVDGVLGELVNAAPGADIIVVSDHGMQDVNVHGTFADDLAVRQLRSGGHPGAPPGVFIAAGPSFTHQSTSLDELPTIGSVFDITPTLLAVTGVPIGRDMPGEPLEEILVDGSTGRGPFEWVDTHTPSDWHLARLSDDDSPAGLEAERLEQLRSLGYLGD